MSAAGCFVEKGGRPPRFGEVEVFLFGQREAHALRSKGCPCHRVAGGNVIRTVTGGDTAGKCLNPGISLVVRTGFEVVGKLDVQTFRNSQITGEDRIVDHFTVLFVDIKFHKNRAGPAEGRNSGTIVVEGVREVVRDVHGFGFDFHGFGDFRIGCGIGGGTGFFTGRITASAECGEHHRKKKKERNGHFHIRNSFIIITNYSYPHYNGCL